MKKVFQYLVKLLFVLILPVVAVITSIKLFIDLELTIPVVLAIIILMFVSLTNAFFFNAYMTKVKLIPKMGISFDLMPIVGFAIGFDQSDSSLVIVIPFCAIELKLK
jgi:hypothetical protein